MPDPAMLSPGPILAMSGAYWRSCALHAGVALDVFTPLAPQHGAPATAAELAPGLGCEPRALGMLLGALAALGLLRKEGERFHLTEASAAFLVRGAPRYQGNIIRHHHNLVDSFGRLAESVKSGGPNRGGAAWSEADREDFLLGMFNLAMGIAPRLAGQLEQLVGMAGRTRMLDLGGGPGTYAIQFCLAHPGLRAAIFDLPTTRPFAQATVERFGLTFGEGGRVDFLPGDYTADPVPGSYDLAWLSQVLHGDAPDTAADMVRKAAAALVRGGVLLVHEFLLNDSLDGPEFPALFSLNMLLGTRGGQSYSEGQVRAMLEAAGLTQIRRLDFAGPNDSGIVAGVKPG